MYKSSKLFSYMYSTATGQLMCGNVSFFHQQLVNVYFFTPDDIELFLRNWINFFLSRQNIKISEVNDHFFVLDSRILFGFDTLYLFPGIQSKAIQLAEESCVNSLVTSGKLHLKDAPSISSLPTLSLPPREPA